MTGFVLWLALSACAMAAGCLVGQALADAVEDSRPPAPRMRVSDRPAWDPAGSAVLVGYVQAPLIDWGALEAISGGLVVNRTIESNGAREGVASMNWRAR